MQLSYGKQVSNFQHLIRPCGQQSLGASGVKLLELLLIMSFPFVVVLQVWLTGAWRWSSVNEPFVNDRVILLYNFLNKTSRVKWYVTVTFDFQFGEKREKKLVSKSTSWRFLESFSSVNRCSSVVMEISWSFVLPNN